ncbi:MAG: NAD(P)/FAD-dependent oxidoreductase [Acutalibacteraceae bacterium]
MLATGNGRCNLTNIHASAKHYYGDTRLIEAILRTYPPQRVIQYFEEIGLLCKEESEGRIYPYSLQASSVLDVLRFNAEEMQVEIICDCPIHSIRPQMVYLS